MDSSLAPVPHSCLALGKLRNFPEFSLYIHENGDGGILQFIA